MIVNPHTWLVNITKCIYCIYILILLLYEIDL